MFSMHFKIISRFSFNRCFDSKRVKIEFTKILSLSETYRRPAGDLSNTHQRPTCLIGDRHVQSETDMPNQRPTCLIGDLHAWSETSTCFIETYLPHLKLTCLIDNPLKSPTGLHRHIGLWWGMSVSDGACRSPMGLQSGMLVSDGIPIGFR